jgi:hypothetical protein
MAPGDHPNGRSLQAGASLRAPQARGNPIVGGAGLLRRFASRNDD